jgi:hypothetical protein
MERNIFVLGAIGYIFKNSINLPRLQLLDRFGIRRIFSFFSRPKYLSIYVTSLAFLHVMRYAGNDVWPRTWFAQSFLTNTLIQFNFCVSMHHYIWVY